MQPNLKIKTIVSTLFLIILLFITITVLGKILVPFLIALILSYIINPFVNKIQQTFKLKRSFISFIVAVTTFLFFVSIPLFLIPQLLVQMRSIIHGIPDIIDLLNHNILNRVNDNYGTRFILDYNNLKNSLISNAGTIYNNVNIFSPLAHNGMILLEILVYIVLIPFVMFYSTNNFDKIVQSFDGFIPKRYAKMVHSIIYDIDKLLSSYLRGQISVMLIMAIYYSVAFNIIGLKSATIIGAITGLLVFIPYLGILTGLCISLISGIPDFTSMNMIIWTLVAFVIGHLLEGGLVTPYLVGGRIGLNPIMMIFALMAFGKLFGVVGVLLALPLATIATVLLQHLKRYYVESSYYGDEI
jgi:predicted PurR-regulated permease PerM